MNQNTTKTSKRIPTPCGKTLPRCTAELRNRYSRARKRKPSNRDDTGRTSTVKRSRKKSSTAKPINEWKPTSDVGAHEIEHQTLRQNKSSLAKPINECKSATNEERVGKQQAAEEFQNRLGSEHPSFVKSMLRSHVSHGFWLGLPSSFCVEHLPKKTVEIVLEDEEEKEYKVVYIGERTGMSGGWRKFALDHKLDDGDAVLFVLVKPLKFKVYVFRGDEIGNPTIEEMRLSAKLLKKRKT